MMPDAEVDFSKFHDIVQEYEKLIKELTAGIDLYKSEYEANKSTITSLVNENKELAARLKEVLKAVEKDEIQHLYSDDELIDNLKKQLVSYAKEKESVVQLWQTALKTVDYLEEELRLYEGRTHGYVPKIEIKRLKTSYEEQIEILHGKIREYNYKIQEIRKTCTEELAEKSKQLEIETNKSVEAQNTIKKLELELQQFQERLLKSEETQNLLQTSLANKNKQIDRIIHREEIAKNKVKEAISVVESALIEKDAALLREAQMREELARLSRLHFEFVQENECATKTKINEIKTTCTAKTKLLEEELIKATREIQLKNTEIDKYIFQLEILQKQVDFLHSGTSQNKESDMNKLLVLEKNFETTFQKLLLSERKNLQLLTERDSIKCDMEQMASQFERDVQLKNNEKRNLEMKFTKLQEEFKKSNFDLVKTSDKLEALHKKYKDLQKEYKTKTRSCRKTLSNISIKSSATYKKLEKCYEKQVEVTKKWKAEAMAIYNTLSIKIKEFGDECKKLKIQNYELKDKLFELESTVTKYQQALSTLCVDLESLNI